MKYLMRVTRQSILLATVLLTQVAADAAITFHVRPDGNDAKSGASPAEAFATLARARDAIRARQPLAEDVRDTVLRDQDVPGRQTVHAGDGPAAENGGVRPLPYQEAAAGQVRAQVLPDGR